jgi:hypothetical protein
LTPIGTHPSGPPRSPGLLAGSSWAIAGDVSTEVAGGIVPRMNAATIALAQGLVTASLSHMCRTFVVLLPGGDPQPYQGGRADEHSCRYGDEGEDGQHASPSTKNSSRSACASASAIFSVSSRARSARAPDRLTWASNAENRAHNRSPRVSRSFDSPSVLVVVARSSPWR